MRDALLDQIVLEGDGDVERLPAGLLVAGRAVVVVVGAGAEGEGRALEGAALVALIGVGELDRHSVLWEDQEVVGQPDEVAG